MTQDWEMIWNTQNKNTQVDKNCIITIAIIEQMLYNIQNRITERGFESHQVQVQKCRPQKETTDFCTALINLGCTMSECKSISVISARVRHRYIGDGQLLSLHEAYVSLLLNRITKQGLIPAKYRYINSLHRQPYQRNPVYVPPLDYSEVFKPLKIGIAMRYILANAT